MIKLPSLNKRNWKKILRELDVKKFPSLPDQLVKLRYKLLDKETLTFPEEALGYARMTRYFEDFASEINALYLKTIDYSSFSNRPPLPHQKEGVEFLLKNNRCILADTMGKAKTSTTIYAALLMGEGARILVVTQKSLKYNFAKEISYFDDRYVVVDKTWVTDKFTIVHYDALKKWQKDIVKDSFDIVIIDEAHLLKSTKIGRSVAMTEILKKLEPSKLWLLTGTPINNRPIDYFNLLRMIKHPVSKNWMTFVERYCAGKKDHWGKWDVSGASNLKELHELIKASVLRRVNTSADGLPNKTRQAVFLELKNRKGYDAVIDNHRKKKFELLKDEDGFDGKAEDIDVEKITELLLYRQFCALEKIEDGSLIDIVNNILEEDETNKIIVFTNFRAVIDNVHEHFGSEICSYLDGRILDSKRRLEIVDEFNEDDRKKVMAVNLKVGSVGHNIQGANYVIVNDMDWVPSNMLQAEARAHRYGQKRDVSVLYPIYDRTVENILYNVVDDKMNVISTVVEGESENYFEDNGSRKEERSKMDEKKSIIEEILAQMGM